LRSFVDCLARRPKGEGGLTGYQSNLELRKYKLKVPGEYLRDFFSPNQSLEEPAGMTGRDFD